MQVLKGLDQKQPGKIETPFPHYMYKSKGIFLDAQGQVTLYSIEIRCVFDDI